MEKKIYLFAYITIASALLMLVSCKKSSFLDARPDNALVVPTTLEDLQAILDNDRYMNGSATVGNGGPNPALGEIGSDDYYTIEDFYNAYFTDFTKQAYIWASDVYTDEKVLDWSTAYFAIFYANIVLDRLSAIPITTTNKEAWNNAKGSALFYRAHTFYQLLQVFAPPYDSSSASADWGIPLRLKSDISEPVARSTVQECYAQIMHDLDAATEILPVNPLFKTRPSKPAVHALKARIWLNMRAWDKAAASADSCLLLQDVLTDYNQLDSTSFYPLPRFNEETIYYSLLLNQPAFIISSGFFYRVDSALYNSYDNDDLRKAMFFADGLLYPGKQYKGSYAGSSFLFAGIASDEVYLIKAEAKARMGNTNEAMEYVNTLLQKRWRNGTFVPLTATTGVEALQLVLKERRKELLFRGLRWTDLRRLQKDGYTPVLTRVLNGTAYTLQPGDNRYTWPIPPDVISFNPSMPQNPR
jgi:starch-binding outer membrane protein, SusD/RagB family